MNSESSSDPMVDEVRKIRREIVQGFGSDIEKLAKHLREVERDYAERRGVFAVVTREAAAKVQTSWGGMSERPDDPMVDQIRSIRTAAKGHLAKKKGRKGRWRS